MSYHNVQTTDSDEPSENDLLDDDPQDRDLLDEMDEALADRAGHRGFSEEP
jgi:hypothetical protein